MLFIATCDIIVGIVLNQEDTTSMCSILAELVYKCLIRSVFNSFLALLKHSFVVYSIVARREGGCWLTPS